MSDQVVESLHNLDDLVDAYVASKNPTLNTALEVNKLKQKDWLNRLPKTMGQQNAFGHTRFDFQRVESSQLQALIARMKSNTRGAKLNGLFEVLLSMAYRQQLVAYGETEITSLPVQIYVLCSFRNKLRIPTSQMGVYSCGLDQRVDHQSSVSPSVGDIWTMADTQTRRLHERLDADEEIFELIGMHDTVELQPIDLLLNGNFIVDVVDYDFMLSNIGIVRNTSCTHVLRLRELYCAQSCKRSNGFGGLFFRLTTVDGLLGVSISYNECYYSPKFIQDLKSSLLSLIESLTSNS